MRAAERYCSLIDTAKSSERHTLVPTLAESLAGLLSVASTLASVDPADTEAVPRRGQQQWRERFRSVRETSGEWAYYWTGLVRGVICAVDGCDLEARQQRRDRVDD